MLHSAIDLNADLGESYGRWTLGDDDAMCELVTSANVACGFHAGDPTTLQATCRTAVAHSVVIGAQVSYPDLVGFGRRFLDIAPEDLTAAVIYQIGGLQALAAAEGGTVSYVKPHGALYHATVEHQEQAAAVVAAVVAVDPGLALLGFPDSALLRIGGERGLRTVSEYFVDRRYAGGRLVDRREPNALLTDPAEAVEQAVGAVESAAYESLCLHGDTPGAVALGRAVRAGLADAGVELRPFSRPAA